MPEVPAAPSNGAHPDTPQTPAQPAPPNDAQAAEAKLKAREEAIAKAEQKYRNQLAKDAADKKGLGAKLSRLSELEKREQLAKLNPTEYAKSLWGDNWHEMLNTAQMNGVPPANLIAAELMKFEERMEAKFAERDAREKEQNTAAQQRQIDQTREAIRLEAQDYLEEHGGDHPLLDGLGKDAEAKSRILQNYIEDHLKAGGKPMAYKDAAEKLEGEIYEKFVERAAVADKYKTRLQEKMKPATVTASSGVQGVQPNNGARKTLSNALTASTPSGKKPQRSEAERMEASIRAFNEKRAKQG